MSDARSLAVGENYGRSKRAALTYTGLLALLTFTQGIPTSTIAWSGIELSLLAAEWLAWFAAAYFVFGFILEWRIALRNNSQLVVQNDALTVKERLEQLAMHFDEMATGVGQSLSDFQTAALNAVDRLNTINPSQQLTDIYSTSSKPLAAPTAEAAYSTLVSFRMAQEEAKRREILMTISGELESFKAAAVQGVADLGNKMSLLVETASIQSKDLKSMGRDFKTLSSIFNIEQRLVFIGYDLVATLAFFGATTVFALLGGLCFVEKCPAIIHYV